ncbi:hypothetical protein GCM10022381_04420 [Leifsonia kafniensis]|uniref:Uncharacterized protein n=1 Tax=Leifsonia kafniensis TaxID=475957 RepID=A0ABP7K4M3_9MICO
MTGTAVPPTTESVEGPVDESSTVSSADASSADTTAPSPGATSTGAASARFNPAESLDAVSRSTAAKPAAPVNDGAVDGEPPRVSVEGPSVEGSVKVMSHSPRTSTSGPRQ